MVRIGKKRNPHQGHVFIAEHQKGGVKYIDPQLHNDPRQLDAKEHWKWASGKQCWVLRIDNLEFTNILTKICTPSP